MRVRVRSIRGGRAPRRSKLVGSNVDPSYRLPVDPRRSLHPLTDAELRLLGGFDEAAARSAIADAHRHRNRPSRAIDAVEHKPLVGHVLSYHRPRAGGGCTNVLVATSRPRPTEERYARHRVLSRRVTELEREWRIGQLECEADA